jgi:hypothetical protein
MALLQDGRVFSFDQLSVALGLESVNLSKLAHVFIKFVCVTANPNNRPVWQMVVIEWQMVVIE